MAAENAYKYDYGYFDTAAAPSQPLERPDRKQKTEQKRNVNKVQQTQTAQARKSSLQLAKAAAVLVVALVMFAGVLNSFIEREQAKDRLQAAKEELVICQAENKELNAKLTALKSVENIDKFAVEKLGLVKVTPENEIYLGSDKGNRVLLSRAD